MKQTEVKMLNLLKRMLDHMASQCYDYATEIQALERECLEEEAKIEEDPKPSPPPVEESPKETGKQKESTAGENRSTSSRRDLLTGKKGPF